MTVEGSTGQIRAHPLLTVEMSLRRDLRTALVGLHLTPNYRTRHDHAIRGGRIVKARS